LNIYINILNKILSKRSFDMILSIGMIVKNEERYLGKCLKALKPVLDAVDSELIIADTGSTDNTVNIAKQFTDNVFHFEWCNDYSKARNSTLDRSQGEWYMFIDADEILQNPNELICFFNSGEYKKYNNASIIIRNINNLNYNDNYHDFDAARLVKNDKKVRFMLAIHEGLYPLDDITKHINAVFLHYGYVLGVHLVKKTKKYISDIKSELQESPYDLRQLNHLSSAYHTNNLIYNAIANTVYSLSLYNNIYSDIKKDDMYYPMLSETLISLYYKASDYTMLLKYYNNYCSYVKHEWVIHINIYNKVIQSYLYTRNITDIIKTFNTYNNLYNRITKKGYKTEDINSVSLNISLSDYICNLNILIYAYLKTKKYKSLEKYINILYNKYNLYTDVQKQCIMEANIELYKNSSSKDYIIRMYNYFSKNDYTVNLYKFLVSCLDNYGKRNMRTLIVSIIKILSEINDNDPFLLMFRLIYLHNSNETVAKEFLCTNCQVLLKRFDETLYYILKYNIPINENIKKYICSLNHESLFFYKYKDCFDVLTNAILSSDDSLIRMCLIERIFAYSDYYEENISNLLDIYYNCVCEYIKHTLNPDILSDTDNLFLLENNITRFRVSYKFLYEAYKINDTDKVCLLKNIVNGIGNILLRYVDKYFN